MTVTARSVSDLAADVAMGFDRFDYDEYVPKAKAALDELVARLEVAEAENERLAPFPEALAAEIEARETAEAQVAAPSGSAGQEQQP